MADGVTEVQLVKAQGKYQLKTAAGNLIQHVQDIDILEPDTAGWQKVQVVMLVKQEGPIDIDGE
jgi:hypothetical protein